MDIVWKIITGVAALFLAVAALFSYWNRGALIEEKALLSRAKVNLEETKTRYFECEDALKLNTAGKDQAIAVRDETIQQVKETEAKSSEAEADIATYKQQNADLATKIADIRKKIEDYGDIEKLIADVDKLQKDIQTGEADIASRTQTLDIAVAQVAGVKEEIGRYQDLVSRQNRSEMDLDFTANVTSVHPTWGFAVINKGNTSGVYQGSTLEIDRGEGVVGKLRITRVEQGRAIGSFVPDTWAEGDLPRPGDVVKTTAPEVAAAPVSEGELIPPALPEGVGAPIGEGVLPAPEGVEMPVDSPFGGAPADPAADGGGDPFGGGGMAPEAEPATPAPASDPFG